MISSNYLTTAQAARLLGVSVFTAQQWVERGYLRSWKTAGGHRRIVHASVMELQEAQQERLAMGQMPYSLPVLIVEDDANLIRLYKFHMCSWPFDVTPFVAPNGYEGLILAGEVQPQLLICDLRLPGINGFNIVRALSAVERFREMKIVVVTGLPFTKIQAHGGLPDRVEIMGKPVNFDHIQTIACRQWEIRSDAYQRAKRPNPH